MVVWMPLNGTRGNRGRKKRQNTAESCGGREGNVGEGRKVWIDIKGSGTTADEKQVSYQVEKTMNRMRRREQKSRENGCERQMNAEGRGERGDDRDESKERWKEKAEKEKSGRGVKRWE